MKDKEKEKELISLLRSIKEALSEESNYVLPKASASTLGGIKVGDTLTIDDNGVLNSSSSVSIDDTTTSTTKTWSSNKINSKLSGKQDVLTAGQNIVITNDTISAVIDAGFNVEVVQTLPTTGEANTIYFVPSTASASNNVYDEYMYINNAWKKIGSTEVDLSNYYNKTEVDTLLRGKQDVLTAGSNITITGNTISATDTTYSAGSNIEISGNTINALGYRFSTSTGAYAEGDRDIVDSGTTYQKSTATGIMSHAEGSATIANGTSAHSEGYKTLAKGHNSHTQNRETIALNIAENAQGSYNISHNATTAFDGNAGNTLHSIGIGTATTARKNAVEVMQNGDAYVYGIGDYDGVHIPSEAGYSYIKSLQTVIDDLQFKVIMLEPCPTTMLKYRAINDLSNYLVNLPDYSYSNYRNPEGYAVFSSDLIEIYDSTFAFSTDLLKIELPEGLTSIGVQAFRNCISLLEVTLPKSVTEIHDEAFCNCTSIYAIRYNGTVDDWNYISMGADVFYGTYVTQIICIDGFVDI